MLRKIFLVAAVFFAFGISACSQGTETMPTIPSGPYAIKSITYGIFCDRTRVTWPLDKIWPNRDIRGITLKISWWQKKDNDLSAATFKFPEDAISTSIDFIETGGKLSVEFAADKPGTYRLKFSGMADDLKGLKHQIDWARTFLSTGP